MKDRCLARRFAPSLGTPPFVGLQLPKLVLTASRNRRWSCVVYAELRRDVAQAAARCLAVCLEEMMHGLPEGKNKNAKTLANVTLFGIGTN
jgi:hypothetical protein